MQFGAFFRAKRPALRGPAFSVWDVFSVSAHQKLSLWISKKLLE